MTVSLSAPATRAEAVAALDELEAGLVADLALAASRGEHVRVARRVLEVRALRDALAAAPPTT